MNDTELNPVPNFEQLVLVAEAEEEEEELEIPDELIRLMASEEKQILPIRRIWR